ncbi:MAG: CDGSH iron-sulfur domain-containing protein [Candidatus Sumerlaeia bacterium]
MARLVRMEAMGPVAIEAGGEKKWVCMCGLSRNKPYCDGSHKQCRGEEEGKTYVYDDEGRRSEWAG